MKEKMNKSVFPMIVAAALFLSLFRLGAPRLFDVDEAVFSEATREMVISHNWITPTYNGENRYDKPILFYWLMAASYKTFGINEFAARFPSGVAAVILAVMLFLFVRRFRGEKQARYAAMSFILSVYYLIYSRAAVTDMTLALFISLSLFSFYGYYAADRMAGKIYLYGFYLFSALAFLTKGLIGIIFPFGIALIYTISTEGLRGTKKVFSLKGALLFTAAAAPWYITEVVINGREFIDQFFIKHHFRRFTDVISGHRGPVYYYVLVMIAGLFPWVGFLPAGIKTTLKGKDPLHRFALIWLAFIFLFFSLSTTKLPNYILPAIPAAAILIGAGISAEDDTVWRRYSLLSMGVLSVLMTIALIYASQKLLPKIGVTDAQWPVLAALSVFVSGALCLYSAFSRRSLYGPIAGLLTVFFAVLLTGALPLASDYLQGTLHKYSLYAKERLKPGEGVVAFGINNPSIAFYSERKIIGANSREDLASLSEKSGGAVAIARYQDANLLKEAGYALVEHDGHYALFEKK